MMNRIGRERGWAPMSRADFDASLALNGANLVGSPQQVIEKILFQHEIFGHDRFLMQLTVGTLPHEGAAGDRALRDRGRPGRAPGVAARGLRGGIAGGRPGVPFRVKIARARRTQ